MIEKGSVFTVHDTRNRTRITMKRRLEQLLRFLELMPGLAWFFMDQGY
jgi:hypothetical protein